MTYSPQSVIQWEVFSDQLLHHFLGKTGDHEVAQDLRQETLLKILENYDTLQERDKQWSWIWTIARNLLNDHWRRKGRKIEPAMEESDPEMEELLKMAKSCLENQVSRLPEKYREAIFLSELEGMKRKDLAKKLGLSESGAKSRVQRGRQLLKEMLFECCQFSLNKNGQWSNEKWKDCL